jgi:hypothetical protein
VHAQPRFEAFWASQASYAYPDDKEHNPWYLDLGDINSGGAGFIGGPNVVTVMGADFCVEGCQENYPDEFCSKYPPEGIPNKPRSVDDWGTKFNITSEVLTKGIAEIQARGGKVILSYGMGGISAQNGGGDRYLEEIPDNARKFAERVKKNVEDWNFDGVDFFNEDSDSSQYWDDSCPGSCQDEVNAPYDRWNKPGHSVVYHSLVIRAVREALGPTKTISYTKSRPYISSSYYHTGLQPGLEPNLGDKPTCEEWDLGWKSDFNLGCRNHSLEFNTNPCNCNTYLTCDGQFLSQACPTPSQIFDPCQ